MSASRPKLGKIKPRPRQEIPPIAPTPTSARSSATTSTTKPAARNVGTLSSGGPSGAPRPPASSVATRAIQDHHKDKVKGKARAPPSRPPPPPKPISVHGTSSENNEDDDEDDEEDFEEVPIPSAGPSSPFPGTPQTAGTIRTAEGTPGTLTSAPSIDDDYAGYGESSEGEEEEVIRLEIGGETEEEKAKRIALAMRKKPMTSKDRAIRLEAHKLHVVSLLASSRIRNRWASNALLRARLLSLLPHPLVSAFTIPPSRFPDRAQRSRLFFDALDSLVTWWSQTFFDIPDSTVGLRTRPWDEVQEIVDKLPRLTKADFLPEGSAFGKGKDKEREREKEALLEQISTGAGGERLRTVNSLMKKALQQEGSRDVSAILFVALARAIGLGTRLVVSLQAVPWRAEKVVAKKKPGAGRGGRTLASRQGEGPASDDESEDELEEVPIPAPEDGEGGPGAVMGKLKKRNTTRAGGKRRLQDPADLYRLRKPKPAPQTLAAKPKLKSKQDLSEQPPVFWAEVFSRSDQRWIPVDPIRGHTRKRTLFEPTSDNGPIRMLYVVAFEEDGYARDVTLRYTKSFGAKTSKLRVPVRKDEPDWWEGVLSFLQRPYRLNRDDLEDAELETSQVSEAMPMHLNGFKDHPIYVLERHLKRDEVLHPKREVGRFRGEPVYRRAHVVQCKTAENWMRSGRRVKEKQEPLKWVKQRAVTLNKRRQQELARQEGEDVLQGLYAEWQTEVYRPPPIKDGIVPQNSFGNIDLYAPTMLPKGSVHLPYKGIAKVAKAMGISYAEACTGFEFKKQRAIPVITGIVVAKENETAVMEAYEASAAAAEVKERARAEDRALKRWAKLINGLRVRRRLQAEYGTGEGLHVQQLNPLAEQEEQATGKLGKGTRTAASVIASAGEKGSEDWKRRFREASEEQEESGALVAQQSVSQVDQVADEQLDDLRMEVDVAHPSDASAAPPEIAVALADEHESDSDEELEEVLPPQLKAEPESAAQAVTATADDDGASELPVSVPATRTIRLRVSANGNGGKVNAALAASVPARSRAARSAGRKRKQPVDESEAELTDGQGDENDTVPSRASRGKGRKSGTKKNEPAVVDTPTTRSLRSRAPKSAEKVKQEEEARLRVRQALDSGEEDLE